jgi:hypothetical protein
MKLTIGDFTRSSLTSKQVNADYSGINLLKSVSRDLSKVADDQINTWAENEVSKSQQAGSLAGSQNKPIYQEGNTLTTQAYNKAAQKSQLSRLTVDNQAAMSGFKHEFKNDPNGYLENSNRYIDEVKQSLEANEQTRDLAEGMEAQLRLDQQYAGYEVSKNFNIKQTDQMKADNEALYQTIKTNTYMGAGGIFSKDPTQKSLTLNRFALNKKMLSASLHATAPNGEPIYTSQQIQAREQQFHSQFYAKAAEQWITEADMDISDVNKLKDGKIEFEIPGAGSVNIYQEIGPEAYEKLKKNAFRQMKDKDAAERQQASVTDKLEKHNKEVNDVKLIDDIYAGTATSTDNVIKALDNGNISKSAAASAIKMLRSGKARTNDIDYANELEIRQAQGEDITAELEANAYRLSATTYKDMRLGQINKESSIEDKSNAENRKWITSELGQKDRFGMVDPKAQRLLSDTIIRYNQSVKDGNSPDLAMEEARNVMDVLRNRENRKKFESVPRYAILKGNQIAYMDTLDATIQAAKAGKITQEQFDIETKRIEFALAKGNGIE